jgi:hypothetical protein
VVPPWHDDGDCYGVPRTFSDADGNFFVPLPDVLVPAMSRDPDDLYAELSMYAHGERFLEFMAERGITEYRCENSLMLANFRALAEDGFEPLNNAFFSDQCDPDKGATMVFGQGSEVDFAYDGDVIYHELGHGIVALLTPDGLTQARPRNDGMLVDASAINEAIADYVSVMLAGDPYLADYVGRFWPSQSTPYIRTATNRKRCPDDLIGESHNDGEPLMGALWAVRVQVGDALDDVVLQALTRLSSDATLEEMAAALVAVASEMRDAGELDADDVVLLERELDARSLLDCPRVITDPASVASSHTQYLRKQSSSVVPWWPGPMQLRYEVPAGHDDAVVEFDLDARSTGGEVSAAVLVKHGDTPIEFTYDLVARDDAGDPTGHSSKVREQTLVSGDWDRVIPAERVSGNDHRVRIAGLRPGQVIHIALADTSTVDALVSGLKVLDPSAVPQSDGSGSDDGSGGAAREDVRGEDAVASCACTQSSRTHAFAWWLVPMLALRRRR